MTILSKAGQAQFRAHNKTIDEPLEVGVRAIVSQTTSHTANAGMALETQEWLELEYVKIYEMIYICEDI